MRRQRIHQLAAQWEVQAKDIIERLEKMGIKGKKAQSALDEAEAERVYEEMGLASREQQARVVSEQRIEVADSEGGAKGYRLVTETRIRPGVILRRTRSTGVAQLGEQSTTGTVGVSGGTVVAATAVDLLPEMLDSFEPGEFAHVAMPARLLGTLEASPEVAAAEPEAPEQPEPEHAGALDSGESEPSASDAEITETAEAIEEEECSDKVPVAEPEKIAAELLSAAEAEAAGDDGASGADKVAAKRTAPRVLGRIDLNRRAAPVLPAQPSKPEPDKPAAEGKPGHKRKRKVVKREDLFDAFERSFQARPRKKRAAPGQRVHKTELTTPKASKRVIRINEATTPGELARSVGVKAGEVLAVLMRLDVLKSINDPIDFDTTTLVADEFGYRVENTAVNVAELLHTAEGAAVNEPQQKARPPVVTVMGHVDHGKTSLLDVIRKSDVVSSEAGGITQHIGAYLVKTAQGPVCFLDTPGHEAFTAMRARGAKVTDIVILVVAADDGVMPQTIEAINHAKAAEVPVVVAINKMDRPDANPDRVKQQLSEHGLQPEEWGGDTQFVEVSAFNKTGIDSLIEALVLLAQILELQAPVETAAHGVVVEARLDRGRGPVATVLIQEGTLHRGDYFVCGESSGRVRAMTDHSGRKVAAAGPSTPVEIIGINMVPSAGDPFDVVDGLDRALQVAEYRKESIQRGEQAASSRLSLEDLQRQVAEGSVSELKVIIKADVDGSAEAVRQALEKLSTEEVVVEIIHSGVGAINESDVHLALASRAIVIGFNVRPDGKARTLAEREGVDIRLHTIIYEVVGEITTALEGLLKPEEREVLEGRAEVRQTFSVPGGTIIAGCYVTEGKILRGARCRLLRDSVVVHEGSLASLRRFKDDVREVANSYECGIGLNRYNDVKPGDVIECFRLEEVQRTLQPGSGTQPPHSAG